MDVVSVPEPEPESVPDLESHRADAPRGLRRSLVGAVLLVMMGGTLVGAAFVTRLSEETGHAVALGGACTLLFGLVLAVGSAVLLLQEDAYLAVRPDGIFVRWGRDHERLLPWEIIARIEAKTGGAAAGILVFSLTDGETEEWRAGRAAGELAARLADFQAKAKLGLLPRV